MQNKNIKRLAGISFALLAATCLTAPRPSFAGGVVAANHNTGVYNASNGVTVVDIAKANSAGLSHNKYTDYNVDPTGLVLNNGNSSQITRQSQLAGQVTANLNLQDQASVILNEVVSTKRSSLNGYTEVLGGKADVVVANPNGITCDGCGFINTSKATLTTGKPVIGTNGALNGFQVDGGDILVTGKGLDGTAPDYTALVARSVKLDGQVNANNLDVVAGANDWDYNTHTATARAPTGDTPLYAVDSSALGGMYANKIRLIATEAGVGVRMAGDAAAASDDFTIDAAGKVQLTNQISAGRDVRVTVTMGGNDAIHATNARISATNDATLAAAGGEIHLEGGVITANHDLSVQAASLTDAATADSAADNNKRYGARNVALATTGAATIDGTVWGAGAALTGTADSLAVGTNGATLYSGTTLDLTTTHDLNLNKAYVRSQGNMTLTATGGGITTQANAAQGVESVLGDIALNAGTGLTNGGTVTADAGDITGRVNGTLGNTGTLYAHDAMNLADLAGGGSENLTNSGTLLGDGALTIHATMLNNSGGLQGTLGSAITAASLTNSGTLIASGSAAHSGTITADSLTNNTGGTISSAKDLTLNIRNSATNNNKILATGDLSLLAGDSGTTLGVTNNGAGVFQAGSAGTLTIGGTAGGGNLSLGTQAGKLLGYNVTLKTSGLSNTGTVQADNLASLTNTGTLSNSGTILGKTTLALVSDTLTNSSGGILQGTQGATISGTTLGNSGIIVASNTTGHAGSLTFDSLTNNTGAYIQSAGALDLTAKDTLANSGALLGTGNVTIRGEDGTALAVVNNGAGIIQSGGTLDIKGYNGGDNATLGTQNGKLIGNALALNLSSLSNSGTIQGGTGASTVSVTNMLSNDASATFTLSTNASGSGTVTADTIQNSGILQSTGDLALNLATQLYNFSGAKILGDGAITLRGKTASSYDVTNAALIDAGGLLDIAGYNAGNAVTIYTSTTAGSYIGDSMNLKATSVSLVDNTGLTSTNGMTIAANSLNLGGLNAYIAGNTAGGGTTSITLANNFSNQGTVYSGGDLTFRAPNITNTADGGIASGGTLDIRATGGNFYNYGSLYAHTLLDARATGYFTNYDHAYINSDRDISITANQLLNYYNIVALRDLTIQAPTIRNEVTGGDNRYWVFGDAITTERAPHHTDDLTDGTALDQYYYYQIDETDHQAYSGGKPADKPQLISGRTLLLTGFNTGTNLGGTISGPTVTFTGNGGATFTNDSLALLSKTYKETYDVYFDGHYGAGCVCFYYDTGVVQNDSGYVLQSSTQTDSVGAAIRAGTLNATGFGLTNTGGPNTASFSAPSAISGGTGANTVAGASTVGTTSSASGTTGTTGGSGLSFGGISVTLPTSPNGYFVVSKDPNSKYLVETNPRYGAGSGLSSDYIAEHLGVDPEQIQRRLGDGNYEASLINQQLVSSTGSNILKSGENEAQQMQRLMDNGIDTAKSLGLTYGTAPTPDQVANLKQDMVWMVSEKVNGVDVLAPVVYLSAATKAGISSGAVIAANDVNASLDSLTNTGGTISGANTLHVAATGDITNTSGTIKGGDVGLTSTNGSIINQTSVVSGGNADNTHTVIGNTATIQSTGNLSLDAKNDITNTGANMSAGGNASLNAGNNITFDTIQDKEASSTRANTGSNLFGGDNSAVTHDASTTNIKSGLTTGGSLTTTSGKDTTFAGTDATVGGNATMNAGGNLNIISRDDSTSHDSSSKTGNALNGSSTSNSDAKTTNVGSGFTVGGDLATKSAGDTTVQGSNLNVTGNGDMHAGGNFNIVDGHNTDTSSSSNGQTGLGVGGGVYGTSTDNDNQFHDHSVGSNLNFGGNGSISGGKTVTVQGSNVSTGGNLSVTGTDVNVVEGRNIDEDKKSNTTVTFGKVENGDSGTSSGSGASAGTDGASAEAGAHAETGQNASAGVSLMDADVNSTDHYQNTASGSSLKSGGSTTLGATNGLTVSGSTVDAGGDVNLGGKNITVKAAKNVDTTTSSDTHAQVGLYGDTENKAGATADAKAGADAGDASADSKGVNAGGAKAGADANADASASSDNTVDISRLNQTDTTTTDITHTGSLIKSGGNMNVKADDQLNVNGSALNAGGDANISAKDMSFTAADDSHTTTTKTSNTHAGLYGGGSADANAKANADADSGSMNMDAGASASANADAGVGFQAGHTDATHSEGTTTAQTSSITSGGNMNRTATGNITDEGTAINSGGDFTQQSTSWDSKAAKNTSFSTDSSETNSGKIGLYGSANAGVSADAHAGTGGADAGTENGADASAGVQASYNNTKSGSTANDSHAVTSTITSGGKMSTTTTGATNLEGTNLNSGGDMDVNAGTLNYKAAQDTHSATSSDRSIDAGGKVGLDAQKEVTATIDGGYDATQKSDSSTTAVVGGMNSGGKLNVKTTGDANFEGTNITSKDDASVNAGGSANFNAAHNTATSTTDDQNASASLSASKGKGGGSGGKGEVSEGLSASGGMDHDTTTTDDAVTGSINSGGKLNVSAGKDATFTGTQLNSGGDTSVDAKGNVNFNAAKSTSSEQGYGASADIDLTKGGKGDDGKKKGSEGAVGLDGNYSQADSTTSAAAGLNSGGKISVKSGNDTNLEGTNITSTDKTSIAAGHDVNFKAATDTSSNLGVDVGLSGSKSTPAREGKGTAIAPKIGADGKPEAAEEPKSSAGVTLGVDGGTATTKTGGSVNAGSLDISAGHDATLEGTHVTTTSDTNIGAGHDVNLNAARSSEIDGSIGGSATTEKTGKTRTNGGSITNAGIGGGTESSVTSLDTGGNLNIKSGNKTSMSGTKGDVGGTATIDAAGGIDKKTVVDGGAQLGTSRAGVYLDVQQTDINAKGGVRENGSQ